MKWLIIPLILVSSCTQTKKEALFSGDHPTSKIRDMWAVCYLTSLKSNPYPFRRHHISFCDCLIDKSREKYSVNDYEKTDNLSLAFTNFSKLCDPNRIGRETPVPKLPPTL